MRIEFYLMAAVPCLLFAVLTVAVYTDLVWSRVFDWLTLPGMGLGFALAFVAGGWGDGAHNLKFSLLGCGIGLAIFGFARWMGGMGGGDVKLAGAVGAIGGHPFVWAAMIYAVLAGFILALAVLALRGQLLAGLGRSVRTLLTLRRPPPSAPREGGVAPEAVTIPYAVAIAAGTLWAFLVRVLM